MEDLARRLISSVRPTQVSPQKFTFFTSSNAKEIDIPLNIILAILSGENAKSENLKIDDDDEGIECVDDSEYTSLKSYISYLITKYTNGKSTERAAVLIDGLDSIQTVHLHVKLGMLKSLLILSESKEGKTNYRRPEPLPYSDGTQTFSLYTDDYFDNISSKNQMLYSNTSQLENVGSNLSLDSGYFSLPSLPAPKSRIGSKWSDLNDLTGVQTILSKYSDISQYNLSSAFASVQKEANPERFTFKRVKKEVRPRLISETPELYPDYIIFIKNKDLLNEAIHPIIHPAPTPHIELFNAATNTLQGIDSNICLMNRHSTNFRVNEYIASDMYSTTPLVNLFRRFAKIGSIYSRLKKLADYIQTGSNGTIGRALGVALNVVLDLYLVNIVNFSPPKVNPDEVSLLVLYSHFHPLFVLMEGLGKIFNCLNTTKDDKWEPYLISLQSGLDLLLYIQDCTIGIINTDPLHSAMCYLLKQSNIPLFSYIQHWIFHGQIKDPTNEFGLEANEDKLNCRDEEFWTRGFAFGENFKFPCFLEGIEDTLLLCGKSLTLLRICDPTHYLIAKQPFSQLRMKLCLNTRVIREYMEYWDNYKDEITSYLDRLRRRQEEERKQIELDRAQVIIKNNEEKRRIAREYKQEQQRIATERKQKLMDDLQVQIEEKRRLKLEQDEKARELDAYYAAKSGTVLEAGVEASGLVEKVKNEIVEEYAALEQEALDKQKIAEKKKIELAEKLGIIETQPETGLDTQENILELSDNPIEISPIHHESIESPPKLIPAENEIKNEVPETEIFLEKDDMENLVKSKIDEYETIEIIETDKGGSLIPAESTPGTPASVKTRDDSKTFKDNFYFRTQKRFKDCSLMEENPILEISEAMEDQYRDFLKEQESFTNYPIAELVKCSYFFPVHTQAKIVNIYVLDYFRNHLELDKHLTVLRKFVMMENGEFGDSLSMQIFNLLYMPDRPQYFFHLNLILEKALIASRIDKLPQVENLVLGYKEQENISIANKRSSEKQQLITDELSNIVLEYNVGWPINVVLRNFTVKTCYTKIFNFLMQVKRSIWCMNSVTSALKAIQDRLVNPNHHALNQIKCLHLYRHEMQHFVTVLQNYIANQVLKVSWASFQARLEKIENLEQLYMEHRNYVNQIMINMVLNIKGKPIYNSIKRIFFFIFKFYTRIQESHWEEDEYSLNNFALLKEQYFQYKKVTDFVCSLITKLINNGYSSQLEYFILLIDFNDRFAKENASKHTREY